MDTPGHTLSAQVEPWSTTSQKRRMLTVSLQSTYTHPPQSVLDQVLLCQTNRYFDLFKAFAKVCCRCGAEYKITANGNCVRKEECNHHWGRLRRHKGLLFCLITCTLFSFLHAVKGKMLGFECSCPFWMELVRASVRL